MDNALKQKFKEEFMELLHKYGASFCSFLDEDGYRLEISSDKIGESFPLEDVMEIKKFN